MNRLTDIDREADSRRQNNTPNEVDEDYKLHAKAERPTQIPNQHQLHQIMNRRIDPSPSLRQQHLELIRHRSLAHSLRHENLLALRESLQH